jgi:1,5-anhydro-D-fructose reductase (1,5-anhydro-D-mannitol-forming)
MRRLGWGIAGASDIAARYMIPALRRQPDAEVVAVASRSPERAVAYAAANSIPVHYGSVAELAADPRVDAVYIGSDNRLHPEQALAAAAAGKAVLCEKPLALTVAQAAEMVGACRAAGVLLGTNHHLRGAAAVRAVRDLVASGRIGRPLAVRVAHATYLPERLRTWRVSDPEAGGGPLNDMGTHDFDALRFVLGDEVVEVTAMTAEQGMTAAGIEDEVMGVLRFAGGALATFHAAYNLHFAGSVLEIQGTEGAIVGRGILVGSGGGEVLIRDAAGEHAVDLGDPANPYEGTVRAFIDAFNTGGRPAATGEDGLRSLEIASAARESARTGRTVRIQAAAGGSVPAAAAGRAGPAGRHERGGIARG